MVCTQLELAGCVIVLLFCFDIVFFVERVCTERKLGECVIVLLFCCLHVVFLSKVFAKSANLVAIFWFGCFIILLFSCYYCQKGLHRGQTRCFILFCFSCCFFSKWFAPSSNSVARPRRLSDKRLSGKAAGLGKHEGKQRGFEKATMVMIMKIMMMILLIMMTSMLTYGKQQVWENMKENKEGLKRRQW